MEGKANRFDALLVEIHELAWQLSLEHYQSHLLELGCRHFDSDFSAWGIGAVYPAPTVSTVTVQRQDQALITEWVPLAGVDSFVHQCVLNHGQCRTLDEFPDYLESLVYREHWHRFQVKQVMTVVTLSHVDNLQAFLCFYRDSALYPFTDAQKRECGQLAHHFELGWKLNRHLHLNRLDARERGYALYDRAGRRHLSSAGFDRLCDRAGNVEATLNRILRRPITRESHTSLSAQWELTVTPLNDMLLCEVGWRSPLAQLSPKRRQVAQLWSEGFSHKQIGRELDIAPATVRNHLQRIYQQLGTRTKAELIHLLTDDTA